MQMQRRGWVLATVALVLISTAARAQDASCVGNGLARNGGFSCANNASEWRENTSLFSCDNAAGALLGADGNRVRQTVTGLLPGVAYTFRYRGLATIGAPRAIVEVRLFPVDSSTSFAGQDDSLPEVGNPNDTGLREFNFTAPAASVVAQINRVVVEGGNGGSLIDDIVITPSEQRPGPRPAYRSLPIKTPTCCQIVKSCARRSPIRGPPTQTATACVTTSN